VNTEACRSCGKPIIWAVTVRGNDMPVNVDPQPDGNIQLVERDGMAPLAKVLKVADRFGKTNLRTSHFVDCPQARKWRKR
jgi:hypothetical protein